MSNDSLNLPALPPGECLPQPIVESAIEAPVTLDSYAGRVHIDWDADAPISPLGQLPFFIDFLKTAGLFDNLVDSCPIRYRSPNLPGKRDLLGTVLLSVLSGHRRYAHITTLRCDPVSPPLLGMNSVLSEDAIRRGFGKIGV